MRCSAAAGRAGTGTLVAIVDRRGRAVAITAVRADVFSARPTARTFRGAF